MRRAGRGWEPVSGRQPPAPAHRAGFRCRGGCPAPVRRPGRAGRKLWISLSLRYSPPTPLGAWILCPLTVKLSMPLSARRTGSRIQACTPSTWTIIRLLIFLASRARRATSHTAPVSLFTIMQAASTVERSIWLSISSTAKLPSAWGGTNTTCQPALARSSSGRRTLGCSKPEQTIFLPKVLVRTPPSRARLFPSLPQEVKYHSRLLHPRVWARAARAL